MLFCSKRSAGAWRELWNSWRYSEVVEFAQALLEERDRHRAKIHRESPEYADQYAALALQIMLDII